MNDTKRSLDAAAIEIMQREFGNEEIDASRLPSEITAHLRDHLLLMYSTGSNDGKGGDMNHLIVDRLHNLEAASPDDLARIAAEIITMRDGLLALGFSVEAGMDTDSAGYFYRTWGQKSVESMDLQRTIVDLRQVLKF
jgi:hypothetical protein